MREISCAICGRAERKVIYESTLNGQEIDISRLDPYGAHYQINRCLACGLVYSSPILDTHDVNALYEQYAPRTNVVAGEEINARRTMELYYKLARPFLPGRDHILDIGCDVGYLLDVARQDDFKKLYGIEPTPAAAHIAATIPGATISELFYEEQELPEAYFDLITLIHVVDHLVDPLKVLERARRQLKPGGVILAVVHNVQTLLSLALGEHYPPYNLYHHYFFSKKTLRRLFETNGFEVMRVAPTYNCYSLKFFVQKTPGLRTPLKEAIIGILNVVRLGLLPLTIPLGNIGIVARRPLVEST